jgi:two-component system CheB/CheR fusion protein
MASNDGIQALTLEHEPAARIVIGADGILVLANAHARTLFHLTPHDIGKPLQDFELSYRPVELRSLIEEATANDRTVSRKDVSWPMGSGEARYIDVEVVPLRDGNGGYVGVQVGFNDVTRYRRLQEAIERSKNELETAYEELQSTNEELETTNEELQSTNEELETTNEELQSTNEELETMNEELQSTNEELETINTELRQRTDELNDGAAFLASILAGIRAGVAVIDRDLKVLVWNERASDLWGLRADEVQGRHLLNLDIGLPLAELRQPIRACLAGESRFQQLELDATNRRGRPIRCTVTCTPLDSAPGGGIRGVILLMGTRDEPAPA